MSGRSERRPARPQGGKVRPIAEWVKQMGNGLPSNEDAERCVLGSVLLDDARFDEESKLNPEDFELEMNRCIFRCMLALHGRYENIDRVTVAEELAYRGEKETESLDSDEKARLESARSLALSRPLSD